MKSFVVFALALLSVFPSIAQVKHKQKKSTAAGTLFFYWGYNRSYYTKSNIRFSGGESYDFKLKDVKATDRPDQFDASVYFNPSTITVPQYNARLGYYINDKWALTIGVDHYKYVMADKNNVLIDGFIAQGIDTNWVGNFSDEPVITDIDQFHYENTNGVNFIRLELMRSFDIWELGRKRQFAITGNLGAGIGPMLTFNDLNFGQIHTFATPSLSGYGLGLNGSVRFEFFKHFFMSVESGLGFVHLTHVRTRPDDRNQFAKQAFGFSSYFATAGVLFYLRPKNGCDSCPHW